MKLKWLALAFLAAMACACSENDETGEPEPEPEKKVLTVEVPTDATLEAGFFWLLISDIEGNLLDTARLTKGSVHTFEAPTDFTEDDITLTMIWSMENYPGEPGKYEMHVHTCTAIPFGKFQYPKKSTLPQPDSPDSEMGWSIVRVADSFSKGWDLEKMVCLPFYKNAGGFDISASPTQDLVGVRAFLSRKSGILLAYPDKLPFLYWYRELEEGTNYDVSANDFLEADTKAIEVAEHDDISYNVDGENQYGRFSYYSTWENGTHTEVLVPEPKGLFSSYTTTLRLNRWDAGWYYYITHDTNIPNRAKIIDGTINATWENNSVALKAIANDATDGVELLAQSNDGGYLGWHVYAPPGERDIILPQIPDFIALGLGETARSFTTLADHYHMYCIFTESSEHEGYYDYLTNFKLVGSYPEPKELSMITRVVKK